MEGIFSAVAQRIRVTSNPLRSLRERHELKQKELETLATRNDMINQLSETKKRMRAIQSCFDLETNFDMIDVYIMELASLEKRYDYLIKEAKRNGLVRF